MNRSSNINLKLSRNKLACIKSGLELVEIKCNQICLTYNKIVTRMHHINCISQSTTNLIHASSILREVDFQKQLRYIPINESTIYVHMHVIDLVHHTEKHIYTMGRSSVVVVVLLVAAAAAVAAEGKEELIGKCLMECGKNAVACLVECGMDGNKSKCYEACASDNSECVQSCFGSKIIPVIS